MQTKNYHIIMVIVYLIPVIGFIAAVTDEVLSEEDVREMSLLFGVMISVSMGICIFGAIDNVGILISKEYKVEDKNE